MASFAPLPAQEPFYQAKPSALACAPVSPPAPTGDATQDKHAAQMARETLDAEFRASRLQRPRCRSLEIERPAARRPVVLVDHEVHRALSLATCSLQLATRSL